MTKSTVVIMEIIALSIGLNGIAVQSFAQHTNHSMPHEMQHGFVLAADDKFASHLVAPGHHSRQAEITGQLFIEDHQEMEFYQERKLQSAGNSYFLFQAQNLNLPSLSEGQVLTGHIVESRIGIYETKTKIVGLATFKVERVLLNIPNPFFAEETQNVDFLDSLLPFGKAKKPHCCDTGAKPCNWKC